MRQGRCQSATSPMMQQNAGVAPCPGPARNHRRGAPCAAAPGRAPWRPARSPATAWRAPRTPTGCPTPVVAAHGCHKKDGLTTELQDGVQDAVETEPRRAHPCSSPREACPRSVAVCLTHEKRLCGGSVRGGWEQAHEGVFGQEVQGGEGVGAGQVHGVDGLQVELVVVRRLLPLPAPRVQVRLRAGGRCGTSGAVVLPAQL